jgi:toxin ParE1/3/4
MQLRFSRRAERDLEDIADFIARDNPARAISYIRELREHCRRLLVFPQAASLRPELGEGVRLSVFGRYLILYLVHDEALEIRRVVHGARDLDRIGPV